MKSLVSAGFLKAPPDQKLLVLQTPLVIKFSERASNQMLSHYDPFHEIGGVLLAVPSVANGNRILLVNRIVFFENLSPRPERSFSRPNMRNDICNAWEDTSKEDKQPYVPMFFHSHPTIKLDYMRNINNLISALTPLATSKTDQEFSLGLQIPVNGDKFLVPNALIVKSEVAEQHTIIGFYGGGITPTDFKEYFVKLTGKTIEKILGTLYSWIEEDPNGIWLAVLLGSLVAIPMVFFHRQAIPLVMVLVLILLGSQMIPLASQTFDSLPNYFAIVRKEGTAIKIPPM